MSTEISDSAMHNQPDLPLDDASAVDDAEYARIMRKICAGDDDVRLAVSAFNSSI